MRVDKLWLVIGSVAVIGIFAYALITGEAERRYEKYGHISMMWLWHRLFRIRETRENFIRFVNFLNWLAIALCLVGTVVVLLWGQ
jgi:hypothetical protein